MKIEPVFYPGVGCIGLLLLSYAKYLHKEVDLIFSNSWSFKFDANSDLFSESFGVEEKRMNDSAKRILGFDSEYFKIDNFKVFFERLQEELRKNKPVILYIDSFYCPWHSRFEIDHGDHYILACSISDENIICIDPGFNDKGFEILPLTYLEKGCQNYYLITENTDCEGTASVVDYFSLYRMSVLDLKDSNIPNRIERFAKYLNEVFDDKFESEAMHYNPWASGVFQKLLNIAGSRRQFLIFLTYIKEKIQIKNADYILKSLNQLSSKWDTVRWLLVKGIKEGNFNQKYRQKIYQLFKDYCRI